MINHDDDDDNDNDETYYYLLPVFLSICADKTASSSSSQPVAMTFFTYATHRLSASIIRSVFHKKGRHLVCHACNTGVVVKNISLKDLAVNLQ